MVSISQQPVYFPQSPTKNVPTDIHFGNRHLIKDVKTYLTVPTNHNRWITRIRVGTKQHLQKIKDFIDDFINGNGPHGPGGGGGGRRNKLALAPIPVRSGTQFRPSFKGNTKPSIPKQVAETKLAKYIITA
jgi:hypothetical protein